MIDVIQRWDKRLIGIIGCGCLMGISYSLFLSTYIMPNLNDTGQPLATQLLSTSFGDSQTYGEYADSLLEFKSFETANGAPVVKHMPGFPLVVAITYGVFGSMKPFLVFQVSFFFASLYFFFFKLKHTFSSLNLMATTLILTFHPLLVRHLSGVMSDVLFSSLLLCVAGVLWKASPGFKDFLYVGILFGLAAYVRESAFPLMLVLGGAYIIRDRPRYLGPVSVMIATFLLLIAPWAVRNYLYTQQFIPLTTKGTELFLRSSVPVSWQEYADRSKARRSCEGGRGAAITGQGRTSGAAKGSSSRSVQAAVVNYVSQPREQVVSTLIKTLELFRTPAFLLERLTSKTLCNAMSVVDVGLIVFHVGIVLFGILLSFRGKFNPFIYLPYWILAQYVQAVLFWSEPRYLMPFYPFLMVIAIEWYGNELRKFFWKGGHSVAFCGDTRGWR